MNVSKIIKISKIPKRDRYDLTVEKTSNFYANDILIHNSSGIFSYLPCRRKLSWKDKVARLLGVHVQETQYDYVFASRRVVKNDTDSDAKVHFYATDIWNEVGESIKDKIMQGITLYGEVVGFQSSGGHIQKGFDYGCKENEKKFYVYRITFTAPDGESYEFTRDQMTEYCSKYDLPTVPLFYYGKAKDLYPDLNHDEHWHENLIERMMKDYTEKDCFMCINKVPEEGVVLVIESLKSFDAFKLKSFRFLEYETKEKDEGVENIEDSESVPEDEEIIS